MYQSENFAAVDFSAYVICLCDYLGDACVVNPTRIRIAVSVEGIHLPIPKAVPCGLLISKLVINALKYAFPDERSGTISVTMSRSEPGMVQLLPL